jgi:stage II sporulation protein D
MPTGRRSFLAWMLGLVTTVARPGLALERRVPPRDRRTPRLDNPTAVRVGISQPGGGYLTRTLPLEDYVSGVLAGEAARDSSEAGFEALAIAIRTFAMANLGRHHGEGFDLCDQTHCQVLRSSTASTRRATERTAGEILLFRGAPASIFYTASCGGRSERPSEVWPGADDPPFLQSRADDACEGGPAWTTDLDAEDLGRALRSAGYSGKKVDDLKVLKRSQSGRVTRLRIAGFQPDEISGQDLRMVVGRTLGWRYIKSTAFELRRTSSGFHFSGHGSGHGVGLCCIGATRLGDHGKDARHILARYFPGLEISRLP